MTRLITALILLVCTVSAQSLFLTPQAISERNGVYFATDRGIKCDGISDDTAVFGFYMGALPSGAALYLPLGACITKIPIFLGNGDSGRNSTIQGMKIIGLGAAPNGGEYGPIPMTGTVIRYAGPANWGGYAVAMRGPTSNSGVENLTIDAQGLIGGIDLQHATHATVRKVSLHNVVRGLRLHSFDSRSGLATGADGGIFEQVRIQTASTPGAVGFDIGNDFAWGGVSGNHFKNVSVLCGSRNASVGYLLKFTDYQRFTVLQALYCGESMRFQTPATGRSEAARIAFPTAIYVDQAAFDTTPTASKDWNPFPNIGAAFNDFHREWNGGHPYDDASYGPRFPMHRSIRGNDSLGQYWSADRMIPGSYKSEAEVRSADSGTDPIQNLPTMMRRATEEKPR